MKKLIALMLVLGIASYANAALQISVGGNPDPVDSEIILVPSETIMLDVYTTTDIAPQGEGEGSFALVAYTECAKIHGGLPVISHDDWSLVVVDDAVATGVTGLGQGENGIFGGIFTFGEPIPAGTIFNEIIFHCETDNGPTNVFLYQLDDYLQVIDTWDKVVIHQIPEPMTIALLGLGGLFLRRRK
jgi:hypothetical protein